MATQNTVSDMIQTGLAPSSTLSAGEVTATMLATGAVTSAKLAAGAVTSAKLAAAYDALVVVADPGTAAAIPVDQSAYVGMTCAGTETGTLANPTFAGQRLLLCLDTATSGSRVVTAASAINQTGNNTLTFAQSRDAIELVGITVAGALKWATRWNDGVALTTV